MKKLYKLITLNNSLLMDIYYLMVLNKNNYVSNIGLLDDPKKKTQNRMHEIVEV